MANIKYCSTCGGSNPIMNGVAPKFCGHCRKPIGAAFVPVVKPVIKPTKAKKVKDEDEEMDDEDEESFSGEIILPTKFEVEVVVTKK